MRLPAAAQSLEIILSMMLVLFFTFEFLFQSPKRKYCDILAEANVWAIPCNGVKECGNGEDENYLICSLPEELTALAIIIGYLILFLSMLGFLIYKLEG